MPQALPIVPPPATAASASPTSRAQAKTRWFLAWAGWVGVALLGCVEKTPPGAESLSSNAATAATNPAPRRATAPPPYLDHAQPKLKSLPLYIGTNVVEAELAMSRVEIATGMMFRESLGWNQGMLFIFGIPHQVGFYMRNTIVPLSAAYIDPDGIILEIHDLHPGVEEPVEASSDRVLYVLEMNQGWFATNRIEAGAAVATSQGALREAFFNGGGPQ